METVSHPVLRDEYVRYIDSNHRIKFDAPEPAIYPAGSAIGTIIRLVDLGAPTEVIAEPLQQLRGDIYSARNQVLARHTLNDIPLSHAISSKLDRNGKRTMRALFELTDEDLIGFCGERSKVFSNEWQSVVDGPEGLKEGWKLFDTRLRQSIQQGHIPVSIEDYEQRTRDIDILLVDPLLVPSDQAHRLGAFTENFLIYIYLGSQAVPSDYRFTQFHELFHAISGCMIRKFVGQDDSVEYSIRGSGLSSLGRHKWADEALTEVLTQAFMHDRPLTDLDNFLPLIKPQGENVDSLLGERLLLRLFLEIGQPSGEIDVTRFRLLLGAYFDDYAPGTDSRNRALSVRQLYKRMRADGSLEAWNKISNKFLNAGGALPVMSAYNVAKEVFSDPSKGHLGRVVLELLMNKS